MFSKKHISATGTSALIGATALWTVNVNTGAALAVLTVYDGLDATGDIVAIVDCSVVMSHAYGVTCGKGLFYALTGGNADVTIGYI